MIPIIFGFFPNPRCLFTGKATQQKTATNSRDCFWHVLCDCPAVVVKHSV